MVLRSQDCYPPSMMPPRRRLSAARAVRTCFLSIATLSLVTASLLLLPTAPAFALDFSLRNTAGGRIEVTWQRVDRAVRYYVVRASDRDMRNERERTMVPNPSSGETVSTVVSHVPSATPESGNKTVVEIQWVLPNGTQRDTRAEWIMRPPPTPAQPQSLTNSVKIATFNVRNWARNPNRSDPLHWSSRLPRIVSEVKSANPGVLLVQEASGAPGKGIAGRKWQYQHLAKRLPDRYRLGYRGLHLHDGKFRGTQGNRAYYDSTRYRKLRSGYFRMPGWSLKRNRWVDWVLLRSKADPRVEFYAASVHLTHKLDAAGSTRHYDRRLRQIGKVTRKATQWANTGRTVFVGGDLNSTSSSKPDNGVHRMLMAAGFYDSYATTNQINGQYPTSTFGFRFPVKESPARRDYLLSLNAPTGSYGSENHVYRSMDKVQSDHFMQSAVMPVGVTPAPLRSTR